MLKSEFVNVKNLMCKNHFLKIIFTILLLHFSIIVFSQQNIVSGTVVDVDKTPIIGVNIFIKGTDQGVITDINGKYSIRIESSDDILIFRYVGMQTQEIAVRNSKIIDVTLQEESTKLDEVVVVGYGTQKKASAVGAISQVKGDNLMQSGTSDISQAISGKLSGVLTMQRTGQPGANDTEILIRGLSSWNGSQPLILVDGVERDFTSMDPNEIETISVLKDASATAVFGARGGNGVIIVTTKRGKAGKPKLSASFSNGFNKAITNSDFIDSYTTELAWNISQMNTGKFTNLTSQQALNEYRNPTNPLKALEYPNVNWFKETTKSFASNSNANITLSGGSEFLRYFVSLGYNYQGDVFKGRTDGIYDSEHWYEKFNYRTNLDFNISKSTTLAFNIGGDISINNTPQFGTINSSFNPWNAIFNTSPSSSPAYYPEWLVDLYPNSYSIEDSKTLLATNSDYYGNPYTMLNKGSYSRSLGTKLFTDIVLDQKLDFITSGLFIRGKVSLSTYYSNIIRSVTHTPGQYSFDFVKAEEGENPWIKDGSTNEITKDQVIVSYPSGILNNFYRDLYYEIGLNYDNSFDSKHNITALLLINRQNRQNNVEFPFYNQALVTRATYNYKYKYLFETNVSYTGSEAFAPGNKFGLFPSLALGWVVSEEQFFGKIRPIINKLKFRYSDGLVGSDKATERWLYTSDYWIDGARANPEKGPFIHEGAVANESAQWEQSHKRDLGIELGFFDNLISMEVSLFDEYREKMLVTPANTSFLVGNSFKQLNLGELKKHGIDIELGFNKLTKNGFRYWGKTMWGLSENRVIEKAEALYTPEYQKAAGKSLGYIVGSISAGNGYFTSIDDIYTNVASISPDANGFVVGSYKVIDFNADGKIDKNGDLYAIAGNLYAPVVYSFSGGLSYKGFECSFLFSGNIGKYVQYGYPYELEFSYDNNHRIHQSALDYWTPVNSTANHSTLLGKDFGTIAFAGSAINLEGRYIRNADYLRLKEVYFGYTFDNNFVHKMGVSGASVFATGNNILTFTKLIEGDPEAKSFTTGFYPLMANVKLGVKILF
ncbi:TonB-dependent receptor SusC [bioreactor metagenome]|uniref:TonB-dependent receptor SusC n=1 Tax=bioreactor metagenome TaxID=1076179 RepID=A0A644WGZ0_9ZZZZ|nr:TonB-dependent receptor [Paludibacter sp.]